MSNEPDEVNSGAITVAILLTAFTTLAVALVVTALVRGETKELRAVKDLTQEKEYRELKAAQTAGLNAAPAWVNKGTGEVSIPIERAMAEVAEAIRANPLLLSPGKPPEEEEEEEESEEEGAEDEESEDEKSEEDESSDSESADAKAPTEAKEADSEKAPAKTPAAPAPVAPKAPAAPVAPAPAAP